MHSKLYSRIRGEGDALIILHGLFGSSDNLGGVASALAHAYQTHAIDLRNHGRSFHQHEMTYDAMALDIVEYMDQQQIERAFVLGHSMGGKVAMNLALAYPGRVNGLLVADISPVTYSPHHKQIFAALFALESARVQTRQEAESLLSDHIEEAGVRQFLLKNLTPAEEGGFKLKINLQAISDNYHNILAGLEAGQPYLGKTIFIAGELSDYIEPSYKDLTLDLFPQAQMRTIPGAGHWLHAEKPQIFNGICERFLKQIA